MHRPGHDESPHRRRKNGNHDELGVRLVDAGASLPALPRGRSYPDRGGQRSIRLAHQAELQRPASRSRLRPANRQLEVSRALAWGRVASARHRRLRVDGGDGRSRAHGLLPRTLAAQFLYGAKASDFLERRAVRVRRSDRKSTRLNSSHTVISYAVFCLKKKKKKIDNI